MRPTGITLVAIYQMLRGFIQVLFALGVWIFTGLTAKLAAVAAEGNAVARFLSSFGKYLGLALLLFAVINVVVGIGLWFMQGWARLLAVVSSAISLAALLPALFHPRPMALLFGLLNILVILYLMMPG